MENQQNKKKITEEEENPEEGFLDLTESEDSEDETMELAPATMEDIFPGGVGNFSNQ